MGDDVDGHGGGGLKPPPGYQPVEHADGTVHAIDLNSMEDDGSLWRTAPVCGTGVGVSSDEGGRVALEAEYVTCTACICIIG